MDNITLLGASLGFSAISLPIILGLFAKNITKSNQLAKAETDAAIAAFRAETERNNLIFETKIEKLIDSKLTKFRESLNLEHRKLSVETLDKISSRLVKLGEKYNKDFLNNLYED